MSSCSITHSIETLPNGGAAKLPAGPLVAWYGDDFTGAAAVMEVLSFAGLPAMLFLEPPTQEQLDTYPGLRGIGVASTARAESPEWMQGELPGIFRQLADLKPGILHYKICSTLDSSPETGSIGCAIEIGTELTGARTVPVLVGAPQMKRYQVFGQLFAAFGGEVYRLDRHPVMARHPVTPMTEADVGLHIQKQSGRISAHALTFDRLMNGETFLGPTERTSGAGIDIVSIDSFDHTSECKAGELIWNNRESSPFVVGSQGVEYALVSHWQDSGALPVASEPAGIGRAERMVSVSGSVSPTTANQIAWSKSNGFACIPFDAARVCEGEAVIRQEEARTAAVALTALSNGRDPLIHTAEGPDDPAVSRLSKAVADTGASIDEVNQLIGVSLGRVLLDVLNRSGTRRAVISGGDTSGHATRQLGIFALSVLAPTIPGASIFTAHAEGSMDGLELALKGGQMGSPDYFGWVRDGGGTR